MGKDTPATETLGEGTVSRTASFSWVGGWVVGVGGRWGGGGGEVVGVGGRWGGGDSGRKDTPAMKTPENEYT